MFEVILPLTFIGPIFHVANRFCFLSFIIADRLVLVVNHDSFAMSFAVDEFPIIDWLFVFFKFKVGWLMQLCYVEIVGIGLVILKELNELLDRLIALINWPDNWPL
jgi:hypothetical protein